MKNNNEVDFGEYPNCPKDVLKDDFDKVLKIHQKILENHSQPIPNVQDLCEIANMSSQKFRILFQKIFQNNYYKYYQEKRIEHAKYLLKENKYTVVQIAYKVGFYHSQNFARAFMKQTGMTAKQYRNSYLWSKGK